MIRKTWSRIRALPRVWLAALVSLAVVSVGALGVAGYRTYDYIEHDNEFCLSCHLMAEPFERFAESAHRGLGCKACHKPTFVGRSQMALAQIVENPDSLTTHAEVPDEKCVTCHVEGDPERWISIANSSGHSVHFESTDTALAGLTCVGCHSTSLHEFAATDQTCAQSGCHTDTRVVLGGMSGLTIHCVACHAFNAPLPEGAPTAAVQTTALTSALSPDGGECLSCHVMRTLVEIPPDEPHQAVCATCHNPHDQNTPAEAVQTCASAGCHTDPETLTPFHRGLGAGVVDDCVQCHGAHTWNAVGTDCLACHQDVLTAPDLGPAPTALNGPTALHAPASPPQAVVPFPHDRHTDVGCAECHASTQTHGAVTVRDPVDCQSCHHTEPLRADCMTCHVASDAPTEPSPISRPLELSTGTVGSRPLPFDHDAHLDVDCAGCHVDGLALSASELSCASCHVEHHRPEARCASCHTVAPQTTHTVEVHTGCTGAGCHSEDALPFQSLPQVRAVCVTCHQELEDHEPQANCVTCHPIGGSG